jgi:hypothetical protein
VYENTEKTLFGPFDTVYHISGIHQRLVDINRARQRKRDKRKQIIKDMSVYGIIWGLAILSIIIITVLCAPPGWNGKINW